MSFDLTTFLLQTINFLVLVVVLWRLLFKPLRAHMRERAARIDAQLQRIDSDRTDLRTRHEELEQQLQEARVKHDRAVRDARADAESERQRLLSRAQDEARRERDRLLDQVHREQARREARFRDGLSEQLAMVLAKLLNEIGDVARLHTVSCQRFSAHLEALDAADRESLREEAAQQCELVLAKNEDAGLTQALSKWLDMRSAVNTRIDPSLIAGAALVTARRQVDGSVRGQLERLLGEVA